jgi:type I restriction enzyme S subunit/DNA-damage-inducible protein D
MKKYDSYKDSGVEWIGHIPEHWDVMKFNLCVKIRHGHQFMNYDFTEDGIKIVKITQLHKNGYLDLSNCSFIKAERAEDFSNILIKEKDILMCLTGGTIGKIIRVGTVNEPLLQNYRVGHFSSLLDNKICDDFIFWVMSSDYLVSQIFFQMRETGQPNIGMDDFGRMRITIPSINEQTIIANFLDHKTTQIDHLIAKKEQFIQLLEEERVAVINQAVTKGLDPTVPVKDSGIEWLGEVPAHWKVKKLKYVCSVISNKAKTKPNFVLALENIESWTGEIVGDPYSNSMEGEVQLFLKDDILFNKLRPYLAKVCMAKQEGGAIGELLVLRPYKIINSGFLYQRLRSEMIITIVDGSTYGTKMPRASWDKFISQLKIGIPPIDEQHLIEKYIIKNEIRISELALKTKQEIELLKEYKTALISEVVTGKVDVREEKMNQQVAI